MKFTKGDINGIYLVTDERLSNKRTVDFVVEEALKGGVKMVQLRKKGATTDEIIEDGRLLMKITRRYNAPLIINDDVDAAIDLGADGVHVGQSDMDASKVRKIFKGLVGVSVKTPEQARKAELAGADYVSVGPIYETKTKKDNVSPRGISGLVNIISCVKCPVVAIGGINLQNLPEVLKTDVSAVAMVSAISSAKDIYSQTKQMVELFEKTKNNKLVKKEV